MYLAYEGEFSEHLKEYSLLHFITNVQDQDTERWFFVQGRGGKSV